MLLSADGAGLKENGKTARGDELVTASPCAGVWANADPHSAIRPVTSKADREKEKRMGILVWCSRVETTPRRFPQHPEPYWR
jgi:hypothetical protein